VDKECAPEGGRRFLPLPIFAAVFFIVLAVGASQMAPSAQETGTELQPTVAELWARAAAGQLDTGEEYLARDHINSIQVDQTDVIVTFWSLPGRSFTLEDFFLAVSMFDLKAGLEVAAFIEYDNGNWTVAYILPASYMF